jgi:hypothetical protein
VRPLELSILPESYAVSRLEASAPEPAWAQSGQIRSVTRTGYVLVEAEALPGAVAALTAAGHRVAESSS